MRPRDIYPRMSKASLLKYLNGVKPLGFRVPISGDYYIATVGEQAPDTISAGSSFTAYRCYPGWIPITPRFIVPISVWQRRYD